jgi:hypothetical protein
MAFYSSTDSGDVFKPSKPGDPSAATVGSTNSGDIAGAFGRYLMCLDP